MSLDLTFTLPGAAIVKQGSGIFIRENGQQKEISQEEWDRRYPDREPVRVMPKRTLDGVSVETTDEVFSRNITHNLGGMAACAGIYDCLWRPDAYGFATADTLIEPLVAGIAKLEADPAYFKNFNPTNGWGNYEELLAFAKATLEAAREYPTALVKAWR